MDTFAHIVILNWNGWKDTVECLESLRALEGVAHRVVVCDNGSSDNSLLHLRQWARDQGVETLEIDGAGAATPRGSITAELVLVDNGANIGFAAGSNTGLRFALACEETTHVWLLNNDTIVEPRALQAMVERMAGDPRTGVCGSLVKFYDDPRVIQFIGGARFDYRSGIGAMGEGRYRSDSEHIDFRRIEQELDYITGCTMLVSREFLEDVGLMEEGYFLYYEEIDWAIRYRDRWRHVVAEDSIVLHKEGSSIGSASMKKSASPLADYYMARSKLLFMSRHRRAWSLWARLLTIAQAINRARRMQWGNVRALLYAVLGRRFPGAAV